MLKIIIFLNLFCISSYASINSNTREKALVEIIANLCEFKNDNIPEAYKESCLLYYVNCLMYTGKAPINERIDSCVEERKIMKKGWRK